MLKLLRKYQTVMLVVFGVFLMIAFLMPQAIQRFGQNPKGRVVARMGDRIIRSLDHQFAGQELKAVGSLAPQLVGAGGMFGFDSEQNNDALWMLLVKAAEDAGMIGEGEDGVAWVPELFQLMATQIARANVGEQVWSIPQLAQYRQQAINDVYVNQLMPNQDNILARAASDSGLRVDELETALAKARGMFRLIVTHNRMARLSRPRTEIESKSIGDQVLADAVFLSASLVESEMAQPTEEQLTAHFERFRDTRAFEGEFGIGYLMPPRVKLEVLKLDHVAIGNAATLDPVAVSLRWQRNKLRFGEDFTVAKVQVEAQLRNEFADEIMRKADRHIKAFTFRARDQLTLDGEYYIIPENWSEIRPTLEQIATYVVEEIEKEMSAEGAAGFVMPRPAVTVLAANWSTYADLQGEESIATAGVTIANQRIAISQLVFAVHEFEPAVELGFQVGLPAVSLVANDDLNGRYFFTVLGAQEESPAASLDEVRETVTADFIRLAGYENLVSRLDEFKQLARDEGLQAVSDLFATEATTASPLAANIAGTDPDVSDPDSTGGTEAVPGPLVQENLNIGDPAMVASLPGEANDLLFREAILEAADLIDPMTQPDNIDPNLAVVGVPLPARLGVEIGRIRLPRPLTIELYQVLQAEAGQRMVMNELRELMDGDANPYSFENLAKRYDWTYVNAKETPTAPDAAEDAAAEDEVGAEEGVEEGTEPTPGDG